LTKWCGYGERENDWLTPDLFSTPIPITNYWKKVKELERRRETLRNEINDASTKNTENTKLPNKRKIKLSQTNTRRQKRAKISKSK